MNTYHTLEEKYLHAVDKLSYGRNPKALKLLNEIIEQDPFYARAHYQLGKLYHDEIGDYHKAGFHFKACVELEPSFPDVYYHYISLVVFLNMEKLANILVEKAIAVPGVNTAAIYKLLGLISEKNKDWRKASEAYQKAFIESTDKKQQDQLEDSLERVRSKVKRGNAYQFHLAE